MPKISALYIYPVKSCKGIQVPTAQHTQAGLFWDRQWMLVKEANGKFITQREVPKLALIEPSLPVEALVKGWGSFPPEAALTLRHAGMPPLQVPLSSPEQKEARKVTVWEWSGVGQDEGADAAAWCSQVVGFPCRLIRYVGSQGQVPAARYTDEEWARGYETRFTDGFPILLASESMLEDLNCRLPAPLPMARFRPNVVLEGTAPWEEDEWYSLTVNTHAAGGGGAAPLDFVLVKPCSRCKVTTVDQDKGVVGGPEPLETLSQFRKGKQLGWSDEVKEFTHGIFFGWNMTGSSTGWLSVGDEVQPTAMRTKLSMPPTGPTMTAA